MRKESGFTIVELMVGLVVGMLVLGGVLSVYLTTIKTSGSTLNSSRLNQELGAIMNIMANDIRRAGYWGDGGLGSATSNPFSQAGSTALEVHAFDGTNYAYAGVQGSGSCVVYAYDLSDEGTLDDDTGNPDEGFGFRWDGAGNAILMKRGHTEVNDCSDTGENWLPLTDTNFIAITNLEFDLANSQCLNTSEPNEIDEVSGAAIVSPAVETFAERDCYSTIAAYAPDAEEMTVEVRAVLITLSAELVGDPGVTMTVKQSVQVRNNLVRQY